MVDIVLANPAPIRTFGGQNQQIIVIPQSLLSANQKKPVVKVSPNISLKRPLTMASPENPKKENDEPTSAPVRKRANLDHLSPEEKMMRRKLKNRVAAQNARDKKRARMEDMEEIIKQLEEEKVKLREENEKLQRANERLTVENQTLRSTKPSSSEYLLPLSPASLPPQSPAGNPDSTSVVPRPSEPAELMNGLLPKGQGLGTAVGQKDQAAVVSAAACLFWTCLVSQSLARNKLDQQQHKDLSKSSTSTTNSSQSLSQTSTRLPLKKRNKPSWWGPQQRSWNPSQATT